MIKFNEPLGLPQGSVRAIITLVLLVSTVIMHYIGKADAFIDGLTILAVGFYIGQRTGENAATPRSESELLMPSAPLTETEPERDSTPTYIPGE